ncbi:MAG TPA: hypothetical protein VE077_12105 [Candidatus Methylomirabilis sp.]|nr:hypothetical protein [Candidatus Methylomirabilis sp.]
MTSFLASEIGGTKTERRAKLALFGVKKYRPLRSNPEIEISLQIRIFAHEEISGVREQAWILGIFRLGGQKRGKSGCKIEASAKSQFCENLSFFEDQLLFPSLL